MHDSAPFRVAVVEDHLLQRMHTVSLINRYPDLSVAVETETLAQFEQWLAQPGNAMPDLVMLDLMAERGQNATPEGVRQLVAAGCKVVVFSALASPPLVRRMIHAGVQGVIGKRDSVRSIIEALRTVLAGKQWMSPELATVIAHDPRRPKLSDQEERVLVLYASGLSLEAVAASIGVKPDTAKKYLQRLKTKYTAVDRPVGTRTELMRVAAEDGFFALTDG